MNILDRLLWSGSKKRQIIGASVGAFIGLLLLLGALQVYIDLQRLLAYQSGSEDGEQFLIINKKVKLNNTFGVSSSFSEEDIAKISAQSFIEEVGLFTSNQYKVNGSSSMLGLYTELFFEAVPDKFVDVDPSIFSWREGQLDLPIIMSRDYLALYNFGFAPSQGLPQFTASTISRLKMNISIKGRAKGTSLTGRIVGFSDRINSILVPQTFMDWANQNYATEVVQKSSRLILSTENAYSEKLTKFLQDNKYEMSSGRLIGGQLSGLLKIAVGVIVLIGLLILILSVALFVMNFRLIIAQAKTDIQLLLQLGYQSNSLSGNLIRYLGLLFGGIFLASILFVYLSRWIFKSWMGAQGFLLQGSVHWLIPVLALVFVILFFLYNAMSIKRNVEKLNFA